MTAQFKRERVLIWGKTYPELSTKYAETVCTAGVRESGEPIRLYPVPLRYLDTSSQYKLYDWAEVPIAKSSYDQRPESFKVDPAGIRCVGHIETDQRGWSARAEYIFKDPSWQFGSMRELAEAQSASGRSLGIIKPGEIADIVVKAKPVTEKTEYEKKILEIQSQGNFFLAEYKELGYRPSDIRLRWRCDTRCKVCRNQPHDMLVLDWGLMELARKNEWDFALAKARLEDLATSGQFDCKLFLGSIKTHWKSFVVVGLWYPKLLEPSEVAQIDLL